MQYTCQKRPGSWIQCRLLIIYFAYFFSHFFRVHNQHTHARAYPLCFRFKQCDIASAYTTVSIPLPSISDSHCMCLGMNREYVAAFFFFLFFAFFSAFFFSVECLQCWFHKTIGKCSAPVFSDILRSICQACEISIAHLNIEWKNRICSINDSVCAFLVGRFHIIIFCFLAIGFFPFFGCVCERFNFIMHVNNINILDLTYAPTTFFERMLRWRPIQWALN